jgi:hypothetical protein
VSTFLDVQNNEDDDAEINRNSHADDDVSGIPLLENDAFPLPDSDDLKEYLKAHESFDDILAIVGSGRADYRRRLNAEKVLQILLQIDQQQLEAKAKRMKELRQKATYSWYRKQADDIERELGTLKNRSLCLEKHKTLICAWLLASAEHSGTSPDPLTWRPGHTIPVVPKSTPSAHVCPTFEIPRGYCCPISSEVMEDPVIIVDNFTYERKNIERWCVTYCDANCIHTYV